jgi:hypothetical protein
MMDCISMLFVAILTGLLQATASCALSQQHNCSLCFLLSMAKVQEHASLKCSLGLMLLAASTSKHAAAR